MSERTQLQYQQITGPVWREPVAEKLAWLPSGEQPVRTRPRQPPFDWSLYPLQPPPAPPYDPQGLEWLPSATHRAPYIKRSSREWSLYPLQPPAVGYNPDGLDWLARDRYSGRPRPRGRLDWGEPSQPSFVYDLADWAPLDRYSGRPLPQALRRDSTVLPPRVVAVAYDPSTIEWQPKGKEPRLARALRPLSDLSVYPLQVSTPAYDPSTLEWAPSGEAPRVAIEVRRVGAFAQPPFSALYAPHGLQWLPSDRYVQRGPPRVLFDVTIEPIQFGAPAYDPRTLEWTPKGIAPRVAVERRVRGDFQQPPFATLYRPELLQWTPSDRYAGRKTPHIVMRDYLAYLEGPDLPDVITGQAVVAVTARVTHRETVVPAAERDRVMRISNRFTVMRPEDD